LISWKHSFKRLKEEYEIAMKKKDALDGLLSDGKISRSTYDVFHKEMEDSIAETEKQQRTLIARMDSKALELETQIKTLEILLANSEIQHVAGEIEDDVYQRQNDLLVVGLESMRQELVNVRDVMSQLSTGLVNIYGEQESEPQEPVEISKATVESMEEMPVEEPEKTCENSSMTEESVKPVAVEAEAREQEQRT
jgi:hypothetical protein